MKKSNLIILVTAFSVLIVIVILFVIITIRNSKDCDQFVIDTYELYTGIDIPKQTNAQCYYDPKEKIRVGLYSIPNIYDFIGNYQFEKFHYNEYKILWSTDFLLQNNVSVPDSSADLYIKIGEKNNNSWQCIVDKNTRKMWFEINWD